MKRFLMALAFAVGCVAAQGQKVPASFRVLAFYSDTVEHDHVDFAHQAIQFFNAAALRDHFEFVSTTRWDDLNTANLSQYQLVVWLDDLPHTQAQRVSFEHYMTHGGGWMGFHIAAYNDRDTHWPWFTDFLGSGVFNGNNWPPLPATLSIDDARHPVAKGIPATFLSPANEWYTWTPSPRLNKDVKVLVTLSPSNYPLGFKDVVTSGDLPVVWTNTRYRMLYLNMGHGDKVFNSGVQNRLFENALLWVGRANASAKAKQ
jgi:type 1 glutamine amidotransferase